MCENRHHIFRPAGAQYITVHGWRERQAHLKALVQMIAIKKISALSLVVLAGLAVTHFDHQSKTSFDAISPVYSGIALTTPATMPPLTKLGR